jgi:hypothetical protein
MNEDWLKELRQKELKEPINLKRFTKNSDNRKLQEIQIENQKALNLLFRSLNKPILPKDRPKVYIKTENGRIEELKSEERI